MSVLSADKLKFICPDAWVARAYGEYLADCAVAQAEFLSTITEAIADDTLINAIDEIIDDAVEGYEQVSGLVNAAILDEYGIDPATISVDSDEYIHILNELYVNHDSDFELAMSNYCLMLDLNYSNLDFNQVKALLCDMSTEDAIYTYNTSVQQLISTKAEAMCNAVNIPVGSDYTLNEGFVNIKSFFEEVLSKSVLNLSDDELNCTIRDASGTVLSESVDLDSAINQVKANMTSCVAWSQGFLAMSRDNVNDALNEFEAQISLIVSNTKESFANSVNEVKAYISSSKGNVKSFLRLAGDALGWTQVAQDTFTTVNNTDIASYTGASPLPAVNLKSAASVATAVGNTLVAVGHGIWNAVCAIGQKLWTKAKPYVKAITNDPVDIVVENDKDQSYAIGNFLFSTTGKSHFRLNYTSDPRNTIYGMLQHLIYYEQDWYGIETQFGEACFRMYNWRLQKASDGVHDEIYVEYDMMYRPRCININTAIDYGVISVITGYNSNKYLDAEQTFTDAQWKKYTDWLNNAVIYAEDDSDEKEKYAGFLASHLILDRVITEVFSDLAGQMNSAYHWYFDQLTVEDGEYLSGLDETDDYSVNPSSVVFTNFRINNSSNPYPATVTNLDFIKVCCGHQKVSNVDQFKWIKYTQATNDLTSIRSIEFIFTKLIMIYLYQRYDKTVNPASYLFLPYCKGTYDFSEGRYRIKTDAENANIANAIVNIIFVVAIVVAAVLICKHILKVRRLKKQAKLNTWVGQQDNAMWSQGKILSVKEQRKYNRYKRRIDKLTGASSGLVGAAANTDLISKGVTTIQQVVTNQSAASNGSVLYQTTQSTINKDFETRLKRLEKLITGE